jgi:hypothetical protein
LLAGRCPQETSEGFGYQTYTSINIWNPMIKDVIQQARASLMAVLMPNRVRMYFRNIRFM